MEKTAGVDTSLKNLRNRKTQCNVCLFAVSFIYTTFSALPQFPSIFFLISFSLSRFLVLFLFRYHFCFVNYRFFSFFFIRFDVFCGWMSFDCYVHHVLKSIFSCNDIVLCVLFTNGKISSIKRERERHKTFFFSFRWRWNAFFRCWQLFFKSV